MSKKKKKKPPKAKKQKNKSGASRIVQEKGNTTQDDLERVKRLADHALEILRMEKMLYTLINNLDKAEQNKYAGRFNWFSKKKAEFFANEGLSFDFYEIGLPYDVGSPLNPVNIGEFTPEDELVVVQVIEPTIMYKDKVISRGTVQLGKVEK
jgi:hypothetical protein